MTEEQKAKKQELKVWKRGRLPKISEDGKYCEFSDGTRYGLETNCYGKPGGFIKIRGKKK